MNAAHYDRVLSRLEKLRWHPSSKMWSACCPAHDDRNPSLWVWIGREGNLIARCRSGKGCTWPAIMAATGTTTKDWFPEPTEEEKRLWRESKMAEAKQASGKIVAEYPYHDAQGKLLYQALRIEPGHNGRKKDFRYRRPQQDGNGWIWNLEGVEKVLYRLPEVLDPSRQDHPVFVVEGEGKVEALRTLGFVATSSPCGAGHWQRDYGRHLAGRRVVVLPDNDEPGWDHAVAVVGSLFVWEAAAVWVIHLPGLPDGGDVVDWLATMPEATKAQKRAALVEVIKTAKKWERK